MGVRNILVLFFSTMAVSLVVLVILFNLLFKNLDLSFETKMPESAPTVDYDSLKDDELEPGENEEDPAFEEEETEETTTDEAVPEGTEAADPEQAAEQAKKRNARRRQADAGFRARNVFHALINVPGMPVLASADQPTETVSADEPQETDESFNEPGSEEMEPLQPIPSLKPSNNTVGGSRKGTVGKPLTNSSANLASGAPTAPPELDSIPTSVYQVYIDGFSTEGEALERVESLRASGGDAFVSKAGGRITVKLGTYASRQRATQVAGQYGAKIREVH